MQRRHKMLTVGAFLLLGVVSLVSGEIVFSGLDLSSDNRLLFQGEVAAPHYGSYSALFGAVLPSSEGPRDIRHLSFFPESLDYLSEADELQIQNRFGVFRSRFDETQFRPVERFPSFLEDNGRLTPGKQAPISASPDGRFLLYYAEARDAYADLHLYDMVNERVTEIASGIDRRLDAAPVAWSPRSDFFVYEKHGEIYYFAIEQHLSNRLPDEELRYLGPGSMRSMSWSPDGRLYYIRGSIIYELYDVEFFLRGLYRPALDPGRIAGRLPASFDAAFDRFWVSPSSTSLLFEQDGRNLTLIRLGMGDHMAQPATLPYLLIPRGADISRVVWGQNEIVTILVQLNSDTVVYRLNLRTSISGAVFRPMPENGIRDISPSPSGRRIALLYEDHVQVKDYEQWSDIDEFRHPDPLHVRFRTEDELIIGGRYYIETRLLEESARTFLGFSQVEQYGFAPSEAVPDSDTPEEPPSGVVLRSGDMVQSYDFTRDTLGEGDSESMREAHVSSGEFRVYLQSQAGGPHENTVMVRDIAGFGTSRLIPTPERRYVEFPAEDDRIDFDHFRHGSRLRAREISLVFNATDSARGLPHILRTLQTYDIRATFFVNGEFIRRYPDAVREIAEAGHEVGSMFHYHIDFSDARFGVDRDFIKRGLAANEDEYFAATGHELSLLWHAPYYLVNREIVEAGKVLNYTYVGRDVDSLDWVPKRSPAGISRLYQPSSELLDRVVEAVLPGSVVALSVGKPGDGMPDGGRDDYLFNRLDVLLNSLMYRGYSVVPVSTLIERAR
ncbi:MAG: polysaccharide deacetylase family protein [Spirochaeta sp.]|nr:polysaccharide deacetylase family protein [Spirochaeta sp.]